MNNNNSENSGKPIKSNRIINAGSPSRPNNIQTPPRNDVNTNGPPRLIRAMRAIRNENEINPNLPLPLQLFDDEEVNMPEHLGPETFANPFFDDEDNNNNNNQNNRDERHEPANPANPTTNGFGKVMCSLKKFIKKYTRLGRSRKHAIAKYNKAKLQFGRN